MDIMNRNVQEAKKRYQKKLQEIEFIKKNGHAVEGSGWEQRALYEISEVYSLKLDIYEFTPFICSLSLINSSKSFNHIKKRQLFQPISLFKKDLYKLEPYFPTQESQHHSMVSSPSHFEMEDSSPGMLWGVKGESDLKIGKTKIKASIQDMHLIFQIISFAT